MSLGPSTRARRRIEQLGLTAQQEEVVDPDGQEDAAERAKQPAYRTAQPRARANARLAYLRVLGGLPAAPTPGTAEQPAGPEQPTGPEQPAAPTVGSPSVALLGYAQTFSGLLDPGADPNDADDAQGKALALAQVAGTRLEALRSAIFGLATAAGGVANASATTAAATNGNTEKMTAAADELTHLVTTADLDEPPQDFDDLKAIAADLALLDELTKAIEAVRASRRGSHTTGFNPRTLPALGPARTALAQTAASIYHERMNSRQYTGREGVAATAWQQAYQAVLPRWAPRSRSAQSPNRRGKRRSRPPARS